LRALIRLASPSGPASFGSLSYEVLVTYEEFTKLLKAKGCSEEPLPWGGAIPGSPDPHHIWRGPGGKAATIRNPGPGKRLTTGELQYILSRLGLPSNTI
jgi:hypothetical protein